MRRIKTRTFARRVAAQLLRCACYTAILFLGLGMASLAKGGSSDVPIAFHSIAQGTTSGIVAPQALVIQSAPAWQELWRQHARLGRFPPPIDFATDLVVGIFLGQQPTAGYRVQVVRVEEGDSGVRVIYQVHNPPPDATVAQVLTQPFHLIRMPRLGLPIRFERR
jgi:PrcB C-terminal